MTVPLRVSLAIALGVAEVVLSGVAAAAGPARPKARLELARGEDAASCIDSKRLSRAVERRLRRRVFEAERAPLQVRVELSRSQQGFVAHIELSDEMGPLGQRELSTTARHCSALDESLALVVALLVDTPPERPPVVSPATPTKSEPSRAAAPPAEEKPPVPATPLEVPADTPAPREPWTFNLRLSALATRGLLPGTAFAGEFAVTARPPNGPLLRVAVEPTLARDAEVSSGAGATFSRQRLGFEVCAPELFSAHTSLCFGQRLGRLHASGFGFDHPLEQTVFTFALTGAFDVRFPLGRYFALTLGARMEAPLSRHRFSARLSDGSSRDVYSASVLSGGVRAGLEVEL
ncbi:MAG: hypothetical protein ACOY0T_34540 [Myxococcota bacterium]